ncbi:competence type IV pilus assembly protein ComGB [Cytobacillus sp. FJAT-54145]|uniref:Competence type IV pilus assembly protein ComGB n=1 Tax=Cytobacillus spartinae TaxID=3299023 RepID=A0ABW6KFI1_9BACI
MKRRRKWTIEEQAYFLRRIGELLERGYPLAEALNSLSFQMKKHRKEELKECLSLLKEGNSFNRILLNLKFNHTLVGFVYFAERHGSLAKAFQDCSEMLLKKNEDLKKLKKVLTYPFMLIAVTIFLFIFMENILLPKFSNLFQSMNLSANLFTKFIFTIGNLVPLLLCIGSMFIIALTYFYVFKFRRLSAMKKRTILSSIPIIGEFFRLLTTHYFSIQLSYLLSGGISILEALKLFAYNEHKPFDKEIGLEIKNQLSTGHKLEDIVREFSFFEKQLAHIVKHGQENGRIDQELFLFSKYCLLTFEERTAKLIKIIQPTVYAIIGVLIVSMYLAILLPMFHLLNGF